MIQKIATMAILLNILSLHCFCSVSADPTVRELEWYLRDHLFRQSNAGNTSFERELLPQKMATLYLRYRNSDPDQLSNIMTSVIEILTAEKVVRQDSNELKLLGRMTRLQCVKCYYINYLTEVEPRVCLRCKHSELQDFPKKKAAWTSYASVTWTWLAWMLTIDHYSIKNNDMNFNDTFWDVLGLQF